MTISRISRLRITPFVPVPVLRSLARTSPAFQRTLQTTTATTPSEPLAPLRKRLKYQAKRQKAAPAITLSKSKASSQVVPGWELTVGIEIHAQLNSPTKLFSPASVIPPTNSPAPNAHVTPFDLAVPGSQPIFSPAVLLPALRAALALNCQINLVSRFDRKHYFWWDQPAGYQITQFYEPFASSGHLKLTARDGIAAEDGTTTTVRIKQVQLEQDTAKTLSQPGDVHWIDFNRAGTPLIEIITEPDLHYPRTAAVFVQKVQNLISAFDACTSGMESGGLRADVNVSVRRTDNPDTSLGTRTEIKNLSTIKAIEDAIIAERDRQIREIESGGIIACETRGWTLGSKETRRLRKKEGEVDYRYMPDPDVPPLIIGEDVVAALRESVKVTPDVEVDMLVDRFGLKTKDALALTAQGGEAKVQYFYSLVNALHGEGRVPGWKEGDEPVKELSVMAANWVVHEFGRLEKIRKGENVDAALDSNSLGTADDTLKMVPISQLSELLFLRYNNKITLPVAKELFIILFRNALEVGGISAPTVSDYLEANGLWFTELTTEEYESLADEIVAGKVKASDEVVKSAEPPKGKVMWLLGEMLRRGVSENMVPENAEKALRGALRKLQEKTKQ